MRNAALHREAILARIRKNGCVLMLDFDGTLSPIVDDYRKASISKAAREALERLARRMPVAVVSGRALSDVRSRVGLKHISYAGSHGLEMFADGRTLDPTVPRSAQAAFMRAKRALAPIVKKYCCPVEDKGRAYAVHFRHLSAHMRAQFVREASAALDPMSQGKVRTLIHEYAFDIMPECGATKASACRTLFATLRRSPENIPVYIGDGLTDEDAFEALGEGITIRVGYIDGSAAKYFFRSRSQVDAFLRALAPLRASRTVASAMR